MSTLSTKCIWFSLWSKLFLVRLPTGTKSSFPSSLNHSLEIEAIFVQSRPRHRPHGGVLHVAPLLRLPVSLFTHLALGGSTPSAITARLMLKDRGSTWRAVNEKTDVVIARRTAVDAPDQGSYRGVPFVGSVGGTMWPVRQIVSSRQPLCSSRVLRSSTCCYGRGKGNLS